MTELIESGRVDAPARRRARWWVWLLIGVVIGGGVSVRPLAGHFAADAARSLQHDWLQRTAYDAARWNGLQEVRAHIGVGDWATLRSAVASVDAEEITALRRVSARVEALRPWTHDIAIAKTAVVRTLRSEIADLMTDARAAEPADAPEVTVSLTARTNELVSAANPLVLAAAGRRHVAAQAPNLSFRFPATATYLAGLAHPTDVATGIHLVLSDDTGGVRVVDADTGHAMQLLPPTSDGSTHPITTIGSRVLVTDDKGGTLYPIAGDPPTRLPAATGYLVGSSNVLWRWTTTGVQRYDGDGRPSSPLVRIPAGTRVTGLATADGLVIQSDGATTTSNTYDLWHPTTAAVTPLRDSCQVATASGHEVVTVANCAGGSVRVYDETTRTARTIAPPHGFTFGAQLPAEDLPVAPAVLSPDGRWCALLAVSDVGTQLDVVDLDNGHLAALTNALDLLPVAWTSDSRTLVVMEDIAGGQGVFVPPIGYWRLGMTGVASIRLPADTTRLQVAPAS